jgi:RNAse (barnase) inhibitor barstar
MPAELEIDGTAIASFDDLRAFLIRHAGLPAWVGFTADAICDLLATEVPRPLTLIWTSSHASQRAMGPAFDRAVAALRDLEAREARYPKRFTLVLR